MATIKHSHWKILGLWWTVAGFQIWIAYNVMTKPLPIKADHNGFFIIVCTIMMICRIPADLPPMSFASYRWQKHCRGLYQTPIAA